MDPIAKALSERGDTLAEVAELLYGDGAWEFVSKKSTTDQQRRERTQARVGLASNVVGLAAGAVGAKEAYSTLQERRGKAAYVPRHQGGVRGAIRVKRGKYAIPLAGAALGLQAGNLAGDAIANRVLARSAKKTPDQPRSGLAKRFRPIRSVKSTMKNAEVASAHARYAAASANRSAEKVERLIPTRRQAALAGTGFVAATGAANYGATYAGTKRGMRAGQLKAIEPQELKKNFEWDATFEISKADEDKRQVFGWASVITMDGKPVVDLQDDYMAMETIEKAAYDYVKSSRKGGDMHRRNGADPHHVSDMIESFVVTDEKKEKLGLPPEFPTGWLVGFQVNDEDTWKLVKDGKRPQFSIHGSGQRVEKVLD